MTGSWSRPCGSRGRGALARSIGIVVLVTLSAACSAPDETEPLPRETPQVGPGDAVASVPDESRGDTPPDDVPSDDFPLETSPPDDTAREPAPPDDTVLEELIPDSSAPTTSVPEEVPETSIPPDDESSPPRDGSAGGEPDDEIDPALVAVAVAGFLALVGVAAWWMLRRDDPDADVGHHEHNGWPDDNMSI